MRVENRTVFLESTDCRRCRHYSDLENGRGWIREPIQDDCPNCLGTGRTKKGKGKGQCKWYSRESHAHCYRGKVTVGYREVLCPECGGDFEGKSLENWTDTVPVEIVSLLPVEVVRSSREHSFIEHNIGVGLFSCTDYGRSSELSDEKLASSVQEEILRRPPQLCKIVRAKNDLTLRDKIVVLTSRNGYSVLAIDQEVK